MCVCVCVRPNPILRWRLFSLWADVRVYTRTSTCKSLRPPPSTYRLFHINYGRTLVLYQRSHVRAINAPCSSSFQIWWVWRGWWRNSGCPRPTWSWRKWSLRWPEATAAPSTTGTLWRWCWGSARPCSNCESASARVERTLRLFTSRTVSVRG